MVDVARNAAHRRDRQRYVESTDLLAPTYPRPRPTQVREVSGASRLSGRAGPGRSGLVYAATGNRRPLAAVRSHMTRLPRTSGAGERRRLGCRDRAVFGRPRRARLFLVVPPPAADIFGRRCRGYRLPLSSYRARSSHGHYIAGRGRDRAHSHGDRHHDRRGTYQRARGNADRP